MTKEEALKILRKDSLSNLVGYYSSEEIQEVIDIVVSQPSLPSNLDEAAMDAAQLDMQDRQIMEATNDERLRYSRIFRRGFKAGAEWMAGQGVTIEDEVCELYDKLYLYYIDDCSSMTPDTSCGMLKELGASKGDKVVVQIRKK